MSVTRVNRVDSSIRQSFEDYRSSRASFALFDGTLYSEGRKDLLMKRMEQAPFRNLHVEQVYMQDDGSVGSTAWVVYHPYDGDGYTMYFLDRMKAIEEYTTDEYAEISSIQIVS